MTGAGGFIGRHLVAELAARGQRVRALSGRRAAAPPALAVRCARSMTCSAPWPEILLAGAEWWYIWPHSRIAPRPPRRKRRRRFATNRDAVAQLTHAAIAARLGGWCW